MKCKSGRNPALATHLTSDIKKQTSIDIKKQTSIDNK